MITTANKIIQQLNLSPHPEGGYFRETYRSDETIPGEHLPERYGSERSFSTAIYFLLKGEQFSAFHRLKSDEMWHFYSESPLTIYCILPDGRWVEIILGNNLEKGETPQAVIRAGTWFAAAVNEKSSYALAGCTVAPGFNFDDFEMGERRKLIEMFPEHEEIITKLTN